jgi:GNAT superfamily N-acetyltransferase
MNQDLEFRQGYFGDPTALQALADLLQDTFEIDIMQQERFGGPDPISMPFGYFDRSGRCIANLSTFSMPLVINGRPVSAAGYQSGAVRPDYRGQGLYRDLMQRAFAWTVQQGFEADILLTDKPALYEPYGFKTFAQSCFVGPAPEPAAGVTPARRLATDNLSDTALIRDRLLHRIPVSERLAVRCQWQMFLLNTCFDPAICLSYLPDDDAVVAWKSDDTTLILLDVVSNVPVSLARIFGALGADKRSVQTHFAPDQLDWQASPQTYAGYCHLMIKGGADCFPVLPAMLSSMADF